MLTRDTAHPLLWFSLYHHVLLHNIGGALLFTAIAAILGRRRFVTAALSCVTYHLHVLGDIVGARGPDGYQWPIPYLMPFSDAWQIEWSYQWELNAWPNFLITGLGLSATFYLAWRRGYSPLEMVSARADQAFVGALRGRFGAPRAA